MATVLDGRVVDLEKETAELRRQLNARTAERDEAQAREARDG